jgi:hypothetical protein
MLAGKEIMGPMLRLLRRATAEAGMRDDHILGDEGCNMGIGGIQRELGEYNGNWGNTTGIGGIQQEFNGWGKCENGGRAKTGAGQKREHESPGEMAYHVSSGCSDGAGVGTVVKGVKTVVQG